MKKRGLFLQTQTQTLCVLSSWVEQNGIWKKEKKHKILVEECNYYSIFGDLMSLKSEHEPNRRFERGRFDLVLLYLKGNYGK